MNNVDGLVQQLKQEINKLTGDTKIETINKIKKEIHEVSPFKMEPVDCVLWVKGGKVVANDYNPNIVAPPEMQLLIHSIKEDGYTQPIVSFEDRKNKVYEVVDGFHRNRVGKEIKEVQERVKGYLPLSIINEHREDLKNRIAATIRHNRARGIHVIEPMASVVARLYFTGWSNKKIAEELGMAKDEVLRLKQFTGLGTLFENRKFSKAWEV